MFQFKAKIKVEFGKPGETIHRIAGQEKVTCIVMGGRGMSTLRRTLLGGVSDYVIKHTQIPVIFIPGLHWMTEAWEQIILLLHVSLSLFPPEGEMR